MRPVPDVKAQPAVAEMSLLAAPLELGGSWGASPPRDVAHVLARMREACLAGPKLLSDRQPGKLRVDNHTEGPPAVWLHERPADTAWIIVDVAPLAWSQLAYQFGHELGHVFCNSWQTDAKPGPPSQWLEEAIVEAFSIRGLGRLAASWESDPPFSGDAGYAASLRKYRGDLIDGYAKATELAPGADLEAWFRAYRIPLERGQAEPEGPAVLSILTLLESDPACVEDLGAANRWPARTAAPIKDYLACWQTSCAELGASGHLPLRLQNLLQLS
jgi:hypothetical protein